MKKILSLLGTITLIGTSTTSLVACNKPQECTKEELDKLKEENKIKTNNQEIKDNLEWIASQEKPFNKVDNKFYYVVLRSTLSSEWKIIKFKNDSQNTKKINIDNNYSLIFHWWDIPKVHHWYLTISGIRGHAEHRWEDYTGVNYFKSVYRWNLTTQEPNLVIDTDGNVKVKGE